MENFNALHQAAKNKRANMGKLLTAWVIFLIFAQSLYYVPDAALFDESIAKWLFYAAIGISLLVGLGIYFSRRYLSDLDKIEYNFVQGDASAISTASSDGVKTIANSLYLASVLLAAAFAICVLVGAFL